MKTNSTVSILVCILLTFAPAAMATTTLLAAGQEIVERAYSSNVSQLLSAGGGVPTNRSLAVSAASSHGVASASDSQTSNFDGLNFQFTGTSSIHVAGPGFISSSSRNLHYLDFDITGQSEIMTINLSTLSMVNNSDGFGYAVNGGSLGIISETFLSPLTRQLTLAPGSYHLTAGVGNDAGFGTYGTYIDRSTTFFDTISFSNLVIAPGAFQIMPLLAPANQFESVPSRRWFDPPVAHQFKFQMTDGSLFTEIMSLPTGFNQPFEVVAEGVSLGFFGPDTSVNFTELLGHGVSAFTVQNIDPGVDPQSQTAFPIQLDFNTATASFTMTPAPEPSTWAILAVGTASLLALRRRKRA